MKYRVRVTRTTLYELDAANADQAIDTFTDDDEVDGNTEGMEAAPLCPVCDAELSDRTTRTVVIEGREQQEATYCDVCDREVAVGTV